MRKIELSFILRPRRSLLSTKRNWKYLKETLLSLLVSDFQRNSNKCVLWAGNGTQDHSVTTPHREGREDSKHLSILPSAQFL